MENRWEMGGESGPRSVKSELHTQPVQELCGGLCVAQLPGTGEPGGLPSMGSHTDTTDVT